MLTELRLSNYRGFEEHTLPFRARTIIVGRNNAGKSTIIEALRLVALATSRFPTGKFKGPPDWLVTPSAPWGIMPSLERAAFDFETAQHRYQTPPSLVEARFDGGAIVRIFVGQEGVFCCAYASGGKLVRDRASFGALRLQPVAILPQIGPLALEEETLTADYVRRMQDTPLSSSHFRNQLLQDPDSFARLKRLVEETWSGVRVDDLMVGDVEEHELYGTAGHGRIRLMIRNEDFVGEAARMGSGLQMWLQTMWLLARTPGHATVILDEPDVYMHPDLERRLVRILQPRYAQTIIATHSAEIMSEVDADEVLVVDRARSASLFATGLPAVQRVLENLGSVHNLHLARLWSARRLLLLEGDDISMLGPLHATLFPASETPFESLPHLDVGGWGGWERVVGGVHLMKNAAGDNILVYCILDRDYRTPNQLAERRKKARESSVQLHIWSKKEIENYLLIPAAITRVIASRAKSRRKVPSLKEVADRISKIAEELMPDVEEKLATSFGVETRGNVGTAIRLTREYVAAERATYGSVLGLVGGKEVLSRLSQWSQSTCGVSFGVPAVARAVIPAEVDQEMRRIITAIESGEKVPLAE